MAYSQEEIEEKFELIIKDIEENGQSLRKALQGYQMPSSKTFFEWLRDDEEKRKRYAHACEARQEFLFEEIIEIADESNADITFDENMNVKVIGEAIQRSRLKIDARKWILSKMSPKKYGDRVALDHDVQGTVNIINMGDGEKPDDEE